MRSFQDLTDRGRVRRLRSLALNALERYDLDAARVRWITNDTNCIFQVYSRTGKKWILRVTLPEGGHTRDHVLVEMDWLSALANDTCLIVPRPLKAQDGSLVVEAGARGVPETRLCAIFDWIPGSDLADHLEPASLLRLGELSASLHAHARTYRPPAGLELLAFDRVFPFPEPVILFEPRFESLFTPLQRELMQLGVDRAQAAIERLRAGGEPMRIIHGDLQQWNVRYSRGVLSPIDFEDLMWGWPVQDIAVTLYYLQARPDYPQLLGAFMQGYQRISPWPEKTAGEINTFMAARGIGLMNFVLQNQGLPDLDVTAFIPRLEMRLHRLLGP